MLCPLYQTLTIQQISHVRVDFGKYSSLSLSEDSNDQKVNSAIGDGVFDWDYKWGQSSLGLGIANSRATDDFWFKYTINGKFTVPLETFRRGEFRTNKVGSFAAKLVYDLEFKRSTPGFGLFEPSIEARIEVIPNSNWKRIKSLNFDVEFEAENGIYSGIFQKNLPKIRVKGIGSVQFKMYNLKLVAAN